MRPNPTLANRFQIPPHTHHNNIARPVLDCPKEAEDDDDDVKEVGEDRSPLVAQEVKDLPFQGQNLKRRNKHKF